MDERGRGTAAVSDGLALRLARHDDVPAIVKLIDASVRGLSVNYYSGAQIDQALLHVFGPDTQLIADRTYYVIESPDDARGERRVEQTTHAVRRRSAQGRRRRSSAGSGDGASADQGFFVHPAYARRGLGRRVFEACRASAEAAGFSSLELGATLPGVPFYETLGFKAIERVDAALPDGMVLQVVRMRRGIGR